MRLAFFGSPDFALPTLRKLVQDTRFSVQLVATQQDRPAGRGLSLMPTPVKQAALAAGLPVYEDIPAAGDLQGVEKIVVVAYGRKIPAEITARWPCINLHPSRLPQYRGPSPLQSALLNGDGQTAVTTLLINEKMDAGDILLQEDIAIGPNLQFSALRDICAARGAELIVKTLLSDTNLRRPQDEAAATYCRKITREDSLIQPGENLWQIHNKVRAIGAFLTHRGKRVKILETNYQSDALEIITVQPEGRRPMKYTDFKHGYGEITL